jgi:hypothetical protein
MFRLHKIKLVTYTVYRLAVLRLLHVYLMITTGQTSGTSLTLNLTYVLSLTQ